MVSASKQVRCDIRESMKKSHHICGSAVFWGDDSGTQEIEFECKPVFVVWKMLRCWESEGVSIPIRYIDYIFNVMIFVNAYDDASDDDND